MKKKHIAQLLALLLVGLVSLSACSACADDADVASDNISKAADNFEVARRIIFLNSITGTNLMTIEGLCSIKDEGNQLEVTCKIGGGTGDSAIVVKHFLGLSDNVTYFVEQLGGVNVSIAHYRVVFNPSAAVPDVDWR